MEKEEMPIIAKSGAPLPANRSEMKQFWPKTAVLCGFRPVIRFDKMPVKVYNTCS